MLTYNVIYFIIIFYLDMSQVFLIHSFPSHKIVPHDLNFCLFGFFLAAVLGF